MLSLGGGIALAKATTSSPFASYALALDFKNGQYWSGGTQAASLSALPGYSYTRSGSKAEPDASGGVTAPFAANTPAIVPGVGYYSEAAFTNLEPNSQTYESRVAFNATVASNTVTAPDGTTNADMLTASGTVAQYGVNFTVAASTAYTTSVFIPAGGSAQFAYIQVNTNSAISFLTFGRATGVLGTSQSTLGAMALTGYAVPFGTGWRLVLTYTTPADITSGGSTWVGPCDGQNSRAVTVGETLPVWQSQTLQATLPTGGPIIPTTASPAAVGADALSLACNIGNEDFIAWGDVTLPGGGSLAGVLTLSGVGINQSVQIVRWSSNAVWLYAQAALQVSLAPVAFTSGRKVALLRWAAATGTWTLFVNYGGVIYSGSSASGKSFLTSNINMLSPGVGAGYSLGNCMAGAFVRKGTFSDADITAILQAA